ncbi:hypothetical protein [Halococcus sp. AFM35]|uniref:hypothetical protein n=1 Tax=Halococcus sp. AFM35 TaxID=3421653 RepID=UPI003EBFFBDA
MERRKFIRSTGAVGATAVGLAMAGCLGGESSGAGDGQNDTDAGDESINAEGNNSRNPGWFDIDANVLEEKGGQEARVTKSSLFRTPDAFGVRFTVVNESGAPLTNLTVNARLRDSNDQVLNAYSTSIAEQESIDDLGTNERWSGDIVFDNTEPTVFINDVTSYDIWASAQAESSGVQTFTGENGSANATGGNMTGDGNMTGNTTGGNMSGGNSS